MSGRIACPLPTLWIFSLSTGEGYTSAFLRIEFLSEILAPHAYNCFLFHQMVGQWYFAATRNGPMCNWVRYRKTHYWFSPEACPVEWYEYPLVVECVVFFSRFMNIHLTPIVSTIITAIIAYWTIEKEESDMGTPDMLICIVASMTGIEAELDYTLDECGFASIGIPVLVGLLNKSFSKKDLALNITPTDLISVKTILDMVISVDVCKTRADEQGV